VPSPCGKLNCVVYRLDFVADHRSRRSRQTASSIASADATSATPKRACAVRMSCAAHRCRIDAGHADPALRRATLLLWRG
jgi:hypothetical protein